MAFYIEWRRRPVCANVFLTMDRITMSRLPGRCVRFVSGGNSIYAAYHVELDYSQMPLVMG